MDQGFGKARRNPIERAGPDFVPAGHVVAGGQGGKVSVCSVSGEEQRHSILREYEDVMIYSICPMNTESVVCLGCSDHNCHLFDFIQNELLFTLEGHTKWVRGVTYYSKTSLLCSGSHDRTIRLWKVNSNDYSQSNEIYQLIGHTAWVRCVCSRQEIWPNRLLSGSYDRTGRIWDLTTQKQISVLERHTYTVDGIDLSSNGDYIVTGSDDGTVCLWDTNTFEKQTTVDVRQRVYSLFCAQKRPNTIVVGGRHHVFIYDPRKLSNGPVSTWEGGEYWSQMVEIDSYRFVHHRGQILRNYDGRLLRKWDMSPCFGCCFVDIGEEEMSEMTVEALPYAVETCLFSVVIVLPSGSRLGCWQCLRHVVPLLD